MQPFVQVDAFTAVPFAGNAAAVLLLEAPRAAAWMQSIAAELGLAETSFVARRSDGEFDLRWFTPTREEELCGHATLAAAHHLWESGALAIDRAAQFRTRSGPLSACRRGDWIEMDFPTERAAPTTVGAGLASALGASPLFTGCNRLDLLVEVESEAVVRALRPAIADLGAFSTRGVIVTAPARDPDGDYHFVSRFFVPGEPGGEDPVTGSAHCALAPYWAAKLGRDELTGFQASARGGVVRVRHAGARTILAGQAVTVTRGELLF